MAGTGFALNYAGEAIHSHIASDLLGCSSGKPAARRSPAPSPFVSPQPPPPLRDAPTDPTLVAAVSELTDRSKILERVLGPAGGRSSDYRHISEQTHLPSRIYRGTEIMWDRTWSLWERLVRHKKTRPAGPKLEFKYGPKSGTKIRRDRN